MSGVLAIVNSVFYRPTPPQLPDSASSHAISPHAPVILRPSSPPQALKLTCPTPSKLNGAAAAATASHATKFQSVCYVVGEDIDTDQIIPAEYLTLDPSKPEEYEKLGSYALVGLPSSYETRFVEPGSTKTKYSVVIAGANFGCGSSIEHAPVALGASGVVAVVAESYSQIFFGNSVTTGEVYPLESERRLFEECRTGDVVTVELSKNRSKLINHTTGKEYKLKPTGDAGPVIEAGGIFAHVRRLG